MNWVRYIHVYTNSKNYDLAYLACFYFFFLSSNNKFSSPWIVLKSIVVRAVAYAFALNAERNAGRPDLNQLQVPRTSPRDFWKQIVYVVLYSLPAHFFLTLSNSSFLRAESTNLQPHLASS